MTDLVDAYDSLFVGTCCTVAAAVLFSYEYVITFGSEVDFFWKRKLTGPSILYLSSKYVSLASYLLCLVIYLPIFPTDESCALTQKLLNAVQVLQFVPWALFSSFRAYALSGKKWLLSLLVFLLSMVPFGINLAQYFASTSGGVNDPIFGCTEISTITTDVFAKFVIVSRTSLITADVLLIGMTLYRVGRGDIWSYLARPMSLANILLRDGLIYFVVLLSLNVLQLTFTLLSIFGDGSESYVSLFTEPLTAVLVTRFLLHLQESASQMMKIPSQHELHISDQSMPSFVDRRVMGSIAHTSRHPRAQCNELEDSEASSSGSTLQEEAWALSIPHSSFSSAC